MSARLRLAATAFALLPVLSATPAHADTVLRLDGTAMIHFGGWKGASGSAPHQGLSNEPCAPDAFCGVGRFRDLGPALVYLDGDAYGEPVSVKCRAYEKEQAIVAFDESWGIVLHGSGTFCEPDFTHQAPPMTDFGNPGVYTTTFEVVDGWGVFAGATGSGSEVFKVAGDEALWRFTGTVTAPAG